MLLLYKLYYCFLRANVSAVYQPFRPCFGCTYLHCTALCFVSELKLKLNKNRAARIVLNVPPRTPSLPQSIYLYYNNYIGCQLKPEYHTNCVVLCIESPTELRHYCLVELYQPCSDTRLRSASRNDYNVPSTNRRFTNSSFSISASPPTVWNCLLSHIRCSPTFSSFLTRLKTHLFNISFSPLQHVT